MMPRALLAAACLLLPAAALAQPRGRFELTPAIGYRLAGDIDLDDDRFFEDDLEVAEGEVYGLFFDIPLGRHLQLELLANRQESELEADAGFLGGSVELADVEVGYYHVGVAWQFHLVGQVVPFVAASAGLARLEVGLPGASAEDRPSASLGGGVKVFLSRHLGFRLEGRGYWVALDDFDDFDDDRRGHRHSGDEDTLTQTEVSAGLILSW